MYSTAFHYCKL